MHRVETITARTSKTLPGTSFTNSPRTSKAEISSTLLDTHYLDNFTLPTTGTRTISEDYVLTSTTNSPRTSKAHISSTVLGNFTLPTSGTSTNSEITSTTKSPKTSNAQISSIFLDYLENFTLPTSSTSTLSVVNVSLIGQKTSSIPQTTSNKLTPRPKPEIPPINLDPISLPKKRKGGIDWPRIRRIIRGWREPKSGIF